jgi:hypothetical protein
LIMVFGSRLARDWLGSRVSVSTSAQAGVALGEEVNVYRPRNRRSHRDHRPGHLDASPLTRHSVGERSWPPCAPVPEATCSRRPPPHPLDAPCKPWSVASLCWTASWPPACPGLPNDSRGPGLGTAEIGRAVPGQEGGPRQVTAPLAKTALATPSTCTARGAITSTQAWVPPRPSRYPDT